MAAGPYWTVDETVLAKPDNDRYKAAAEVSQRVNFGPQEDSKFALFDGFVFSRTGRGLHSSTRQLN